MKIDYKNVDNLIKLSREIHKDKYDYSLLIPTCNREKIKIICPDHGIFEQKIYMHIFRKQGCPKCEGLNMTNDEFIKQSEIKHKNKYLYDKTQFTYKDENVIIKCLIHGYFEQNSYLHLKGHGCPKCAGCKISNTEEFINKAQKVHNKKYNYSLVDYKNTKTKVKIICKYHGEFIQNPNHHLRFEGCPKCSNSKNESLIEWYLIHNKINYEIQKKFDGCKYKRNLKFDFYLPKINTCVEYDGEQHFKKCERWKDNDSHLNVRIVRDQIKNDFCEKNNIKLFRIKYDDNVFEKMDILKNEITQI